MRLSFLGLLLARTACIEAQRSQEESRLAAVATKEAAPPKNSHWLFGPSFGYRAGQRSEYITFAETTLVPSDPPFPAVSNLVLWAGMDTWRGGLIEPVVISSGDKKYRAGCRARPNQWCAFASTYEKGKQVAGDLFPVNGNDALRIQFQFDDSMGGYLQRLYLRGRVMSSVKRATGKSSTFYTRTECQEAHRGAVNSHVYLNTTIVLSEANPDWGMNPSMIYKACADSISSPDGGKTWFIPVIRVEQSLAPNQYSVNTVNRGSVICASSSPELPSSEQAEPQYPGSGQPYPEIPNPRQPYPGQPYPGITNPAQPYLGNPSSGQPYPGLGQSYPGSGESYPGNSGESYPEIPSSWGQPTSGIPKAWQPFSALPNAWRPGAEPSDPDPPNTAPWMSWLPTWPVQSPSQPSERPQSSPPTNWGSQIPWLGTMSTSYASWRSQSTALPGWRSQSSSLPGWPSQIPWLPTGRPQSPPSPTSESQSPSLPGVPSWPSWRPSWRTQGPSPTVTSFDYDDSTAEELTRAGSTPPVSMPAVSTPAISTPVISTFHTPVIPKTQRPNPTPPPSPITFSVDGD